MPSPTSSSPTISTSLTGNSAIDSLLDGYHWSSASIAYSFPWTTNSTAYFSGYNGAAYSILSENTATYHYGLNATQQAAAQAALQAWANVANLSFNQVADTASNVGDIRFAWTSATDIASTGTGAWGWGYTPNGYWPSGGDIWISSSVTSTTWSSGSYNFNALMHEVGHALGLKHPFDSSTDGGGASIDGTQYQVWDSRVFTIMAYTVDQSHPDAVGFTFNPTTPMLLDIAAIQSIYGANYSYNSGNTTYSFNDNPGQYYFQTIWDGGGTNTISYSGTHNAYIDLRQGYGSAIGNSIYEFTATNPAAYQIKNIWIAYGTNIQDLDLSACYANFTVICNSLGDTIIAGHGTGSIAGGAGNDTIYGGGGVDTYINSGASLDFKVTVQPSSIIVQDTTGANGTDTLTNIQQLQFTDATLQTKWLTEATSLANTSPAQFTFLTELYIAYFNRAPDAVGLDYWASVNYEGHSLSDIAGYISAAPETVSLYSPITSSSSASAISSFITSVYQNVLDRAPDSSGAQYWLGEIQSGAVTMAQYIGDVIYAATTSGNSDAVYLANKELAGAHFAITDGLTNGTQAHAVMALFNSTYQSSGAAAAITAANNLSDSYLANVATNHELVVQLVGVPV